MQDKLNKSLVDFEEGLSESPTVLATLQSWRKIEEILPLFNEEEEAAAEKETPKLNLKPLPVELKYTYLEENNQCPVVISSSLTSHQENCLMEVLKRCKKAIGWQISDLKGIRIIYPISNSPWVSPTQVVPKKSGITVVQNEKGEEITTRLTSAAYSSWQSFWKLKFMKNQALELHSLCQSRSKYARKEQWRRGKQSEENRGQQLQSSFTLLEHFPKSIFYMLYTISNLRKSRIQRFKPYNCIQLKDNLTPCEIGTPTCEI
ncbi:hypothetical protein AAG906_018900 [Vitis piasezkii]